MVSVSKCGICGKEVSPEIAICRECADNLLEEIKEQGDSDAGVAFSTNRHYPPTKWSYINTPAEQYEHIKSEYVEFVREFELRMMGAADEELADLEHAIQTYWDTRRWQGIDVDAVRRMVIKKNRARGYYVEQCSKCKHWLHWREKLGKCGELNIYTNEMNYCKRFEF